MRNLLLWAGLLVVSPVAPLAAQTPWYGPQSDRWDDPRTSGYPQARIWVENEREYFRRGERLGIRFSTADDAYVALVHIDTDGNLDFLYPQTPWDEAFVRGGRVHSLPRAQQSGWTVRGRPGIGYLFLIASPVPLDYRRFSGRRGAGWDWSYAGRTVRGDPFWAMEQITRTLVPDWPYAPYALDQFSYYVDGRFRYPQYACADRYSGMDRAWGWYSSYGSCDRLDQHLREHPYYYDARLYRGDRRTYYRDRYQDTAPRHGYKESVGREPARGVERGPQRNVAPRTAEPQRRDPLPRDDRRDAAPTPDRRSTEERGSTERRPALERRGGGSTGTPAAPRPVPRAGGEGTGSRPASSGRAAPRPRGGVPRDTLTTER